MAKSKLRVVEESDVETTESNAVASTNRESLRAMVRSHYMIQKLRIQNGNRLVANYYTRMGKAPSDKIAEMDKEDLAILDQILVEYTRLADAIISSKGRRMLKKFTASPLIPSLAEFQLIETYSSFLASEEGNKKAFEKILEDFPIYTEFLSKVKGCGPILSAIIISELNPHVAQYPSSFWKYAGYDVGPDGKGRSSRVEHQVEREYVSKSGETKTKMSITHNRFLKTKLYLLGGSFLKCKSPYADLYWNYRNRQETDPAIKEAGITLGNIHMRSMRYMIKIFLLDLHIAWRRLEGLPVSTSWHEAKHGKVHGIAGVKRPPESDPADDLINSLPSGYPE